jgi:DNA-binding MarR family transcriptional regulator
MDENKYECLRLENQLCFPLYASSREILKKYTPLLKELDITYTQYIALMVLWECKEVSIKDLCKKLYLDTGTLSPMLKSMEKRNLLKRSRKADDERVVTVKITDEGIALREKAVSIPQKVGACLPLEKEEAETLYRLLYKIIGAQSQ